MKAEQAAAAERKEEEEEEEEEEQEQEEYKKKTVTIAKETAGNKEEVFVISKKTIAPKIPDALSVIEQKITELQLDANLITERAEQNINSGPRVIEVPKMLYWGEEMDMDLAKFVRSSQFNFEVISSQIKEKAVSGGYGDLANLSQNLITAAECTNRWAQLDASRWSEPSPDSTSFDAVHQIFISPSVLGNQQAGHGSQPSYDQLRSISSGFAPSYLKAPTIFPSTANHNIPEEDDIDDVIIVI
jgi:hypothetical protein